MVIQIGFMQGRLSPLVDNQIQAFPFNHWDQEFALAKEIGLGCMEWTLDCRRDQSRSRIPGAHQHGGTHDRPWLPIARTKKSNIR